MVNMVNPASIMFIQLIIHLYNKAAEESIKYFNYLYWVGPVDHSNSL